MQIVKLNNLISLLERCVVVPTSIPLKKIYFIQDGMHLSQAILSPKP